MSDEAKKNPGETKATAKATVGTPPLQQPAAPAKAGGEKPEPIKNINDLSGGPKDFIDDLLVEGATFEDVVESVAEKGDVRVTLQAVMNYFRSNLDLQKRRVLRQVEKAQELKKSLGDPDSAEAKLADAIFVTGYMGVTRKGAELKLKDVESIRLSKENLRLRNRVLRNRQKEHRQQRRFRRLREDLARKKLEFYTLKSAELKRAMAAERKQNKLGPETMRAIQEIYGIATIPSLPAEIR